MSKRIRITMANNSAARKGADLPLWKGLGWGIRHNGGKLVIAYTVGESELAAARELLDNAHQVASYEIV